MGNVINAGSGKHFFIDQRYFDRASGIRLCMNPPSQSPEPVMRADNSWERQGISGYNTII